MEGTTEFDAPFKYFSHIRRTEGHGQGQYARDQVYSMKNSAASGIQTHHRFVKEKSVFSDFSYLFLLVHKYVSSSKY